jgi:sulfonate transport system substrate-binding protein
MNAARSPLRRIESYMRMEDSVIQIFRQSLSISILALSFVLPGAIAEAQPLNIRLGNSSAAEEPLTLLLAKPELGTHYGKSYVLAPTRFAAADVRFQALEADAVDVVSMTAQFAISAASEVNLKAIASISQESAAGFQTFFAVMDNSPIRGPADVKGKTIGINGFQGAGQLWALNMLAKYGIGERDVTWANVSLPAMAESLRAGKIDVAMFAQPFAAMAEKDMKIRKIFSSKDAIPFDEELMVIVVKPQYLEKNAGAMRDFLADLKATTRYYNENTLAARQILLDTKKVGTAPDLYLSLNDYAHRPSMEINAGSMEKMQELLLRAGFQLKTTDLKKLVDNSYLPKN